MVEYRVQDYRTLTGEEDTFDRIVSVGMFEHVGPKNYELFFKVRTNVGRWYNSMNKILVMSTGID